MSGSESGASAGSGHELNPALGQEWARGKKERQPFSISVRTIEVVSGGKPAFPHTPGPPPPTPETSGGDGLRKDPVSVEPASM